MYIIMCISLMLMSTCIVITCCLSLTMPFMKSILVLGATLVTLAIMSTLIIASVSNSWFGFITFLIYITGLLVLFGYMLVVSPNSLNKNKSMPLMEILITLLMIITILYLKPTMQNNSNSNTVAFKIMNIYESMNLAIYIFMVCILFVALVLAVYLSYKSPKPMRSFLN